MHTSTLSPCLLVASPSLTCSFFSHSVVLLVDHREEGSLGFVINRSAHLAFDDVLKQVGLTPHEDHQAPVLLGGPCSPETGWLLFDPADGLLEEERQGIIRVESGLAVSANMAILERIAMGTGPTKRLMLLGYAGWGPGQLDQEIREGSWVTAELDPSLLFSVPTQDRWRRAWDAIGVDPAQVVGSVVLEA